MSAPPAPSRPGRDRGSPPAHSRRDVAFGSAFPALLAAARTDAPWAYRKLFDWLGPPVAGYMRSQGVDDPDGLANDIFLRAFTHLGSFEGDEDGFRSWVFTIAHHLLIDERRRSLRRPVLVGGAAPQRPAAAATEDDALTNLGTEGVVELLGTLSPDQRDVMLLRVIGDLTVEQVAVSLGKTPGAVKQLQRRARAVVRSRLAPGAEA